MSSLAFFLGKRCVSSFGVVSLSENTLSDRQREEEYGEEGGDGALWGLYVCSVYCQTLKDLQALSSALSGT